MSPTAVLNLHTQCYAPLRQCYRHIHSYAPYYSVKPPHKEFFPPTVVLSLHIQSCSLFLHIKSYVPCSYCSVKPPHTGLCPLRQCYPHINSYVPYCSVKPPHPGLCTPTVVLSLHIQSCNLFLHIKSYVPYYSLIPPHTGLCPLRQYYPHINSNVPYCSVKPPHTALCTPTVVLSLHIQSCNLFLHIKSYVPYCSVKPSHKELFPLR